MKYIPLLLAFFIYAYGIAQEIEVKTEVSSATVYLKGAQVLRKKTLNIPKGTTSFKFTGLSPYLSAESMQVSAGNGITVLGVKHFKNKLADEALTEKQESLEKQLEELRKKIEIQDTQLEINEEEIAFLRENRRVAGEQVSLDVSTLRSTSHYFSERLSELKMRELQLKEEKLNLQVKKNDIEEQLKRLGWRSNTPVSEIIVEVSAVQSHANEIQLKYMIESAGWRPSYNIRVNSLSEPIQIELKADVRQMSEVDWKDVDLTLSTANPYGLQKRPEIIPWRLSFNQAPPDYTLQGENITGQVVDEDGLPVPGANVVVKGTTVGTQTGFDGYFNLPYPGANSMLEISFLGYKTATVPVHSSDLYVRLTESTELLEEVVVSGYSSSRDREAYEVEEVEENLPVKLKRNPTSVAYEVETPYTIDSDVATVSVDIKNLDLPVSYQYVAVPRVTSTAFLQATLSDLKNEVLLAGTASIYLENTYVGQTLLEPQAGTDSLNVSIGQDQQVQVSKKKVKQFESKNFLGSRLQKQLGFEYLCVNEKEVPINIQIIDQVPVTTREDIEITIGNRSGAQLDNETGKLTWSFELEAGQRRILNMDYEVRYPNNRSINLE